MTSNIRARRHFKRLRSINYSREFQAKKSWMETCGQTKRREALMDTAAAFDEKPMKVRSVMVEFMEGLDEARDRIMEVEVSLHEDFANNINQTIVSLHDKDEALEVSIDFFKE